MTSHLIFWGVLIAVASLLTIAASAYTLMQEDDSPFDEEYG